MDSLIIPPYLVVDGIMKADGNEEATKAEEDNFVLAQQEKWGIGAFFEW